MITWPRDLVSDLARRRAVLVLGAGVSMNSTNASGQRPKDWASFLKYAIQQMKGAKALVNATNRLVRDGDYLTACDVIRDSLGRNAFCDLVREQFLDPQFRPVDIHKHIEQIDSRIVLTPNFDKIYDSYVASQQNNSVVFKSYQDKDLAEAMRISQRVIVKIHGSVDAPGEMIFTREDYARARTSYRACYEIVSALILTHTFVFVGCGISDPDTALLMEDYAFSHQYGRHHYLITNDKAFSRPEIRRVVEKTRNISCLEYASGNHHRELTDSLADLVNQVVNERMQLTNTLNW